MSRLWVKWFLPMCVAANALPVQPTFFRKDIPVPGYASAGDFNGDRLPDLAVCSNEGLIILLSSSGGNFARPIRAGISQQVCARDFPTIVDVDGDGKDDLVTFDGILLSRGDDAFLPGSQIPHAIAAAAGDFNRDGKIDLVVVQPAAGAAVWLGNGDGTFRPTPDFTPLGAFRVLVADFNRDGWSDVTLDLGGEIAVFLGKGNGTFGPEIRTRLRSMLRTLPVADSNGEGVPDLVVEGGIALGKGDGTFLTPIEEAVGWGVYDPAAAVDLDGDDRLDLVTSNNWSNTLTVLVNRAKGEPELRRAVSAASDSDCRPRVACDPVHPYRDNLRRHCLSTLADPAGRHQSGSPRQRWSHPPGSARFRLLHADQLPGSRWHRARGSGARDDQRCRNHRRRQHAG